MTGTTLASLVTLACLTVAVAEDSPARRAEAVWARTTGNTETPKQIRYSEDGATVEWCSLPGVADAINALIPQLATLDYPTPESVVPLVDTNGVQVGTARIVVDAVTMQPVAVVNSASPQRPWAQQRADVTTSLSSQASIVQALKSLKVSMTNSIATAQAIDPTAWTGAQRTQMQAVRKNLIDQAQSANTLRRMLLRYYRVED